jgi:tRNA (cytidine/uridine-2'-O-)-methyltransferase
MRIALYQPDQAGNVGTILRLGACMGVGIDIIEPCGFPFSDRALKRAGMDYAELAAVTRHAGWEAFLTRLPGRLVLFTTAAAVRLPDARFEAHDTLLMGSESRGAPDEVHARADLRVRIPQMEGTRSLNIAVAAGIGLAEAMRQTGWTGMGMP